MKPDANTPGKLSTIGALKKRVPLQRVQIDAKTPEQLIEDIAGVLNNRKELLDKISKKFAQAHDGHRSFAQYLRQTKNFQAALLHELSAYGDGLAGPDPHNAYNDYWRTALKKWESINQPRLISFWRTLETLLRDMYDQTLQRGSILPATARQVLQEQFTELEAAQPGSKK